MTDRQPDLIIRAGRVFCADAGLDSPGAVAVWDGRITASGPDVSGEAREILEFSDGVLLPGFVDLHAHPAPMAWRFGIDGDSEILPQGATTVLSQGDAGAETWSVYPRDDHRAVPAAGAARDEPRRQGRVRGQGLLR